MRYFLGLLTVALVGFGVPLNAKEYKYKGETFQLDDSKGCYVEVTYKHLTGYVGVNLGDQATDKNPYAWGIPKEHVTSSGLKSGRVANASFESNLDALCARLLRTFRAEEARKAVEEAHKAFDPAKYCAGLHDGVKNLP